MLTEELRIRKGELSAKFSAASCISYIRKYHHPISTVRNLYTWEQMSNSFFSTNQSHHIKGIRRSSKEWYIIKLRKDQSIQNHKPHTLYIDECCFTNVPERNKKINSDLPNRDFHYIKGLLLVSFPPSIPY